ncbi:hypothetical protein FPV67DRAFT_1667977 [Lyophyllum atratum]|nr:hypothetical protein FPV67DRAFT_1667977 [Lyophyllum atratum]
MSYNHLGRRNAIDMTAGKQMLAEYNLTSLQMAQLVTEQRLQNAPPLENSLYRMSHPSARCAHPHSFGGPPLSPSPPIQNLASAIFYPRWGGEVGIPILQCLANDAEYISAAKSSILHALPEALQIVAMKKPRTHLVIDWPGYNHLNQHYDFNFGKGDGCTFLTVGEMATQIAQIYQRWYKTNHRKFREVKGAVRLGLDGAEYQNLRLCSLCLVEGAQNLWKADFIL